METDARSSTRNHHLTVMTRRVAPTTLDAWPETSESGRMSLSAEAKAPIEELSSRTREPIYDATCSH